MRIKLLLSSVLISMVGRAHAQYNLVPNHSFEDIVTCPTGISGFDYTSDFYVAGWYAGSGGTSDYFNSCAGPGWVGVPANLFSDDQPAHSGNAYGGGWMDIYDNNSFTYREYMQTQLSEPLEAGKCYYVEFYSAPATQSDFGGDAHATSDCIGAYFSVGKAGSPGITDVLPVTPQIDNNGSGNYIDHPGEWTKICGYFEAAGGEDWICIGNYHPDDAVTCTAYEGGTLAANPLVYLFVDDVLVTPIDSVMHINDTIVCAPFEVTAPSCANSYLWSTGATTESIMIYTSGTYWLQMETSCSTITDSMTVTFVTDSVFTSKRDTTVCFNTLPLVLDASPSYDAYLWSTGATTASINIDSAGTYYVTGYSACATFIDSFNIDVIEPVGNYPDLGPDTLVCADNFEIPLSAPDGFDSYAWSTGETTKNITATEAGTYWVHVESTCETAGDTMVIVTDPYLHATLDIGEDLILCPPGGIDQLIITASGEIPDYTWSTGENTSSIVVTEPGTYWVESSSLCKTIIDTVHVTLCEDVGVPSAFSPNGDGINDNAFVITIDPSRIEYFQIYNRWGQLVYDGDASHYSWDGNYNNEPQPIGSYVYILKYHFDSGMQIVQGNITLVR